MMTAKTPTREQHGSTAGVEQPGLQSDEAQRRLAQFGPNEIQTGERFRLLRSGLAFSTNPLVLILLAASVVSGLLGEVLNATLIALMVILSVGLNFVQIFRSEQAAHKLRSTVALTATVWRDGSLMEIAVREVVPGDLLEVRAGDLVPADAELHTASTLSVDEAALTGESLPVEKHAIQGHAACLFAGTSIVSGVGQAVVTATGQRTQFGAIARALVEKAPPTEYERGARSFGLVIMRTVLGLVFFVFLVNALLKRDPLESLLFALALAVGLTPEFLPMITTVTLGQGAMRMAKEKVIVKRLEAIENLGNMDILCSDKTGTLTLGSVVVQTHVDAWGAESEAVLKWACINSTLESGIRSPLDAAILAHEHPAIAQYAKRAELPLDFERRRVSVLVDGPEGRQVITKGAPEGLLPVCAAVERSTDVVPFTPELKEQAEQTFADLSRAGYHLLAIARKPVPPSQSTLSAADERDLVLCGYVAFLDPPDPTAKEAVAALAGSGVGIKILTGDGELVARTICAQVGLRTERVLLGTELEAMNDDALGAVAELADVFARVSPAQKNRIIRALKRRGHVVGYIG
ncbi:MAG: HAD-IC family P-type ATPase, partial [Chloroflexota bacterium]|nr:HAD-IC family P-type ATPase [Chloroflexota bacterium]